MSLIRAVFVAAVSTSLLVGCGSGKTVISGVGGGTGTDGGNNMGGGTATGGNTAAGGGTATGGGSATGGGTSTGGGTATGGGTTTGGGAATGGGDSTGGGTATGGGDATGGGTAMGGGSATGGGTATGGGSATGGGTSTGGGAATGGGTGTGGGMAGLGDTCANTIDITSMITARPDGGSGTSLYADVSTMSADYEGTCAADRLTGRDIVYKLTLSSAQNISVTSVPSSGADSVLYLRKGTCASGMELACADSQNPLATETIVVKNQPPGDYFLFVDAYSAVSSLPQTVDITLTTPAAAPANDTCAAPIDITPTGGTTSTMFTADNTSSNNDDFGTCRTSSSGSDVTYKLTLTQTRNVRITAQGVGDSDPIFYLRSGDCATGSEVPLSCQDTTSEGGAEAVTLSNVSAGTYYLIIDSWNPASSAVTTVTVELL